MVSYELSDKPAWTFEYRPDESKLEVFQLQDLCSVQEAIDNLNSSNVEGPWYKFDVYKNTVEDDQPTSQIYYDFLQIVKRGPGRSTWYYYRYECETKEAGFDRTQRYPEDFTRPTPPQISGLPPTLGGIYGGLDH